MPAPRHRPRVRTAVARVRRWPWRTIVNRGLLGIAALQVTAATALTLTDRHRKRGRPAPDLAPGDLREVTTGDGDRITVYTYGQDAYDAMLEAIEGAQFSIALESFIWKGDETGQQFKEALIRAAQRGVEVRLVWDRFANLVVDPRFFRFPQHPKLHVQPHPLVSGGLGFFLPQHWGRNHRKLLVVDEHTAFTGGYNLGSLYATDWRDTHARIVGPSVAELANAFEDYWNATKAGRKSPLPDSSDRGWLPSLRVQRNVPPRWVFPIRYMYLEAIDRASERVWLTHAYLIPDDDLMHVLLKAVQRGVDVRIIVPADSNHVVADWLSRGYYDRLLAGGVRLFLYQNAMVHAKTATIDGQWSTIGTANLDRLSLMGNYEVNIEVIDPALAQRMEEVFEADLERCVEVDLARWRRRRVWKRATEAILAPLRPLL